MNNSIFGKTLENIRNRVNIRLITSDKVAQKLAAKPNYDCCTIFDENLIAVHMKKTKLYFSKSVYLGMSILDLSKILMYDFHYNYIMLNMGIRQSYFHRHQHHFDTSNYPTNHPSGIKTGLKRMWYFKFRFIIW